ncbi:9938_t:CDS:1, partial [Paraglomus brasilianum]
GTTQKPVINRESENIIKDLLENPQEDLDVIKDKLCDPVPCEKMTPKLWRKYQMAKKCWRCEEIYMKLDIIKFVYLILKLKNTWVLHIENVMENDQILK